MRLAPATEHESVPRVTDVVVENRRVGSVAMTDGAGAWKATVHLPHIDVRATFYTREQAESFVAFVANKAAPLVEALREFKGSSKANTYGWAGNGRD